MTDEPKAPGARAVVLDYQEVNDENLNMNSISVRIKILTEAGKPLADQELPNLARTYSIEDVSGRTIHSDGTVIAYTGKPYRKLLDSFNGRKYSATVFTLPDVQVGSIIEYHYKIRFADTLVQGARWYVQGPLFVEHAKYEYVMFSRPGSFITGPQGETLNRISYASSLPPGSKIVETSLGHYSLELKDLPALAEEPYTLPESSRSYRVEFYYLGAFSKEDFWKSAGKAYSKRADAFAEAKSEIKDTAAKAVVSSDSDEQKARKLYAVVMGYDNTHYSHVRSENDEKAVGLSPVRSAADVIARKRGNEDQIALTYLALVRAAGLRAYAMRIADRRRHIFADSILDVNQFDDDAVIVIIGGKETLLDPGVKFCPFGQLAWFHTMSTAMRQSMGPVQMVQLPSGDYKDNLVLRIAKLQLMEDGTATGTLRVQFSGQPALEMRQRVLDEDTAAAQHYYEDFANKLLSNGTTVTLTNISSQTDIDKPLVLDYQISGPIGNGTSRHFLVPIGLFETNHHQLFTAATRQDPVILDFPYVHQDQIQLTLPSSITVESTPKDGDTTLGQSAIYRLKLSQSADVISVTRICALGNQFYKPEEYPQLKDFFAKARAKDDEQVVFKVTAHASGE